ncbi:DNA helicase-2 / ATP-dependent DNA helicase PcrA [Arthrobacter alpinus]|uniref:DNA 3'-5' helicase n=1 Tax=Arthrobacter alpinus TaxID=656366 RepID=A0A1H5EDE8_9MICC|nr:ATP-dependent helicase [Arthrobacter alpinus]SED89014.1 DNA helicase-2 / ATP-dependent DNA helicase PcrA [Arthrobacter alpinus]
MLSPTPDQQAIRDAENLNMLIIAPAGCGKTEALALRIAGLIQRDQIKRPKRILVTTFSKKARDNIGDRLAEYVSGPVLRDRITTTNFHGLAARLIRSHGNVVGLSPEVVLPDGDWVGEQCRLQNLSRQRSGFIASTLRDLKLHALNDSEIKSGLELVGDETLIAIEALRIRENRLTYDDLLRYAELILMNPMVAQIYSQHFGAVIVDEFQDLTPQQLRVISAIGKRRTTFAGDLAQGIYSFTGARPLEVLSAIRAEEPEERVFTTSHRSSPAVLAMVNSLSPVTGGEQLHAADAEKWFLGGLGGLVDCETNDAEANWVVGFCKFVLGQSGTQRIGVLSRSAPRRSAVDDAISSSGLPWFRWDDPILEKDVARELRGALAAFDVALWESAVDQRTYLRSLLSTEVTDDPDTAASLLGGIDWIQDQLSQDTDMSKIRERVRATDKNSLLGAPGVHLLSGHAGKGQQFDWVCVVGFEQGSIPSSKAESLESWHEEARVFSVMISRARHGAVVLGASKVRMPWGTVHKSEPSSFRSYLQESKSLRYNDDVVQWLREADWSVISST